MNTIPPDIYECVGDLAAGMTNATLADDHALAISRQMTSDEPTHTILIALGEQLIAMGRREQGEAFIRDGHAEALRRGECDPI